MSFTALDTVQSVLWRRFEPLQILQLDLLERIQSRSSQVDPGSQPLSMY